MTEGKPLHHLIKDNILFLSVPLCSILGMIKFDSQYKIVGLCLFVLVFCVIYKLYTKAVNDKRKKDEKHLITGILSSSGFIITVGFAVFAEFPTFRWLFLIGIILSVIFSDIVSALMSTFAYVLIITVFTNVTPEFVANSFLTAVILIILTQYYSDFTSVIYSIVTLISFEIAFFIIMHGLRTDKLVTASHIIEAGIISGCIIVGWLLSKNFCQNEIVSENIKTTNADENELDIKDAISININNMNNEAGEIINGTKKDYSYLLSNDIEVYNRLIEDKKVFDDAKRTSKLVKDITKLMGGNEKLAEVGAFYAECGRIVSNNYIKEGLILAKENNFPGEVTAFIKEHNFKLGYPKSRETAITMIVCKLSSTIAYLRSKGIKRNITVIVDGVMDSCLMAGKLDAAGLSLNDYKFIKDYLIEEAKVEYDYFGGK